MLDFAALHCDLDAIGLDAWKRLDPLLEGKVADRAHGKLAEWRAVLARLPAAAPAPARLNAAAISVGPAQLPPEDEARARKLLLALAPWRKGPFRAGGIFIDSEWRSERKWTRVENAIAPIAGRAVLDVGCGNGYYALRMRGAGARVVIGIEPTLLYLAQFRAISHWMRPEPVHVLPLRLAELPAASGVFDTVFSMGVLYHQRDPRKHLAGLFGALRPGGELVLETLVLPGEEPAERRPAGRYARMRNVWLLPTLLRVHEWLAECGLAGARTVDVSRTTTDEQRSTEWMPFESLAQALDPADPGRTVEGWPAPRRALLVARRPA